MPSTSEPLCRAVSSDRGFCTERKTEFPGLALLLGNRLETQHSRSRAKAKREAASARHYLIYFSGRSHQARQLRTNARYHMAIAAAAHSAT